MQAPPGFPAVPRQVQVGDVGVKDKLPEILPPEGSDVEENGDNDVGKEAQGTPPLDPGSELQRVANQEQLPLNLPDVSKEKPRSRPTTPPLEQVNRGIRRILRASADEPRLLAPTARTAKGPDGTRGFKYGRGKPLPSLVASDEAVYGLPVQGFVPPLSSSALVEKLKEQLAAEVTTSSHLRAELERTKIAMEELQKVGVESIKPSKPEKLQENAQTDTVGEARESSEELQENLVEAKSEIARLQHELFEAKFEVNRLRGEAEDRQKDNVVEGKQDGEELGASVRLMEELSDARSEIGRLQHELFEAKYESERLKSEMQESIQIESKPTQQVRDDSGGELLWRELEGVSSELHQTKVQLLLRDEEIVRLRNNVAEFAVRLEHLQRGLSQAEEAGGRLSEENVQLREDVQKNKSHLAATGEVWAANEDLQKKVTEAEAEIQRMRDQLEKARDEIGVRGRHVGIRKMQSGKLEEEGRVSSRENTHETGMTVGVHQDFAEADGEQGDVNVPPNGAMGSESECIERIATDVAELGMGDPSELVTRSQALEADSQRAKELELRVQQAEGVANLLMHELQEARNAAAAYSQTVHDLQTHLWNTGAFNHRSHASPWFGPQAPPPPPPSQPPGSTGHHPPGPGENFQPSLNQSGHQPHPSHHHPPPWIPQQSHNQPQFHPAPPNVPVRPPPPQGPPIHVAPSAPPYPVNHGFVGGSDGSGFPPVHGPAHGILASLGVRGGPLPVQPPPTSQQVEGGVQQAYAPSAPPYAVNNPGSAHAPSAPPAHLMNGELPQYGAPSQVPQSVLGNSQPSAPPLSQMQQTSSRVTQQNSSFQQFNYPPGYNSHPSETSPFTGPPNATPSHSQFDRRHTNFSMGLIPTAVMLSSAAERGETKNPIETMDSQRPTHGTTRGTISHGTNGSTDGGMGGAGGGGGGGGGRGGGGGGGDLGDEGWADEVIVFRGRIG